MTRFGIVRAGALLGAAAVVVLGAAGCGTGSVPKDDVQTQIATQLQKQGVTVDNNAVTCPGDLPAEVGQSVRCTFVTNEQPVDAVAKVSSVDGSTVNFDITTEAKPVLKSVVEKQVSKLVGDQNGVTVDKTECGGDLQPQVGQSQTCTITSGSDTVDVKVTVTKVDGGQVNFSIEQA